MYRLFRQSKHLSTSLISIPALSIPQPNTSFFTPKSSYTKKNAVNTQKPVRKIILLRTDCIFGQFCKLELVGAQPLHLAIARPFCRLKAPLGLSLLHFVSQTRIYPRECDCMKKINIIINIFIAVFIGVFIGHGVYTVWDFKTHPELYVVQSAPWYTSILIYGVLTIILLLICIVIKVIINHKSKQK